MTTNEPDLLIPNNHLFARKNTTMTKTIIPADKPLLVWHFLRQDWETDRMVELLPADLQTRYIESRKQ